MFITALPVRMSPPLAVHLLFMCCGFSRVFLSCCPGTALPLKCVTAETGGVWEEMLLRLSEDAGLNHRSSAQRRTVHSGCGRNA